MRVTFPDGTVIWHRQAINTFIDALRKIGLERIPVVGIEHGNRYNLVALFCVVRRAWLTEAFQERP